MSSHRRDPYLWLHLAGLATVPLWLDVCLAGLAIGEPIAPPWLEITTLTLIGALPIVWLQLRRPVYIFGVPGLALRPDRLSEERRRLLTLQRSWWSRGLVVLAAIALWTVLYRLYQLAPMAIDLPGLAGRSRTTGWAICAGAFGLANLFTLVPATVVPLLLTSPQQLNNVAPFEASHILSQFWVLGLRLSRILPEDPQPANISDTESLTSSIETFDASHTLQSQSSPLGTDEVTKEPRKQATELPPESPDRADSGESFPTVSNELSHNTHTVMSSDAEAEGMTHTAIPEFQSEGNDDSQLADIPTAIATTYSSALSDAHHAKTDAVSLLEEPMQSKASVQTTEVIHSDADIAEEQNIVNESELVNPPDHGNGVSESKINGRHSVHSGLDPS